jgi:hypothetical protein
MRKSIKSILLGTVALLGMMTLVTACDNDDDKAEEPIDKTTLVGTEWATIVKAPEEGYDAVTWVLTFSEGNRFTFFSYGGKLGKWGYTGNYVYHYPKATCYFDKLNDIDPDALTFDLYRTADDTLTGYVLTKDRKLDFRLRNGEEK